MRQVTALIATVIALNALPPVVHAQTKPDFSGTWTLVSEPGVGTGTRPGRDSTSSGSTTGGQPPRTGSSARRGNFTGAAFSCDEACMIIQTARTLTVKLPVAPDGLAPPDVVLPLDGTETTITQILHAGEPSNSFVATAKWQGNKLVVTRLFGPAAVVQTLALEGREMTITIAVPIEGVAPFSYRYVKR
jgi:hypothetical protein